ncbi:murein transglycosylase [Hwanghaeella grinnelliae]|uniref:peptidoglycan lytic exotransglycosylase n=1 Tax=Hwanghaeella grinnelliae TaxID=2500179 RepID=A0A3S2WRL5_9PROT|nr:MltA domain-containing protein [Hwanghaeella grinnelliae]RVU36228.1 murein transglycosylase [Hwanghaeella grinnelliae]
MVAPALHFRSFRSKIHFLFLAVLLALVPTACEKKEEKAVVEDKGPALVLAKVGFADLTDWQADHLTDALPALRRSCKRILALDPEKQIGTDAVPMTAADWRDGCGALTASDDDFTIRSALETYFTPMLASNRGVEEGLFTGYFEAELLGAATPDETYRYPIYKRPADHVIADLGRFDDALKGKRIVGRVDGGRFVPYPDRGTLEQSHLPGKGLELFWAKDRIDVFLLQVQGSGRVILPDGTVRRIGFDGHNGRPYKSIGRVLIDRGELEAHQASWDGIRGWIERNPDKATALLAENPRFIFFREIDGEGPIGAEGLALTPGRSMAVDRSFVPMGVPLWLETNWPSEKDKPLNRLMVAQDTGGAIKGPVRGDFFWGYGAEALKYAGKMKSTGRYYLLLPNAAAARLGRTS